MRRTAMAYLGKVRFNFSRRVMHKEPANFASDHTESSLKINLTCVFHRIQFNQKYEKSKPELVKRNKMA